MSIRLPVHASLCSSLMVSICQSRLFCGIRHERTVLFIRSPKRVRNILEASTSHPHKTSPCMIPGDACRGFYLNSQRAIPFDLHSVICRRRWGTFTAFGWFAFARCFAFIRRWLGRLQTN